MTPPPITVALVDDHPVVRAGLRAVIDAEQDLLVVAEAGSGDEALVVVIEHRPQVVLCDLRLVSEHVEASASVADGIAVTAAIRALEDPPAVLILTTFADGADILAAVEAGAAGYLVKDSPPEHIIAAVRTAAVGGTVLTGEVATRMVSRVRSRRRDESAALTDRERQVLVLVARGATNKEIAAELFVTEATVKTHLVHIFHKLGADNRARAIHLARERGLLDDRR